METQEDPEFTPPMDTSNLQQHREQFPPKETQKQPNDSSIPGKQGKKNKNKNPTLASKWVGEADRQSYYKSHPRARIHNWEQTHNSELLSEEWKFWSPHLTPHYLRPVLERWAPKRLSFESHEGFHPWDPQGYNEFKNHGFTVAILQGLVQRKLKRPVVLWKRTICLKFQSEGQASNLIHV